MMQPAWELTEEAYIERRVTQQRSVPPQRARELWIATFKREYRNRLRKAIRLGKEISGPILSQSEEIRKAVLAEIKRTMRAGRQLPACVQFTAEYAKANSGRKRYRKGWRTSFANSSEGVDLSLLVSHGVKVKRQDGEEINLEQKDEIKAGLEDLFAIFDSLRDALRKTGAIVCHTSGKHPFMTDAGGTYHPLERSLSVGLVVGGREMRVLAHEIAHWLDYEAGRAAGLETDITDLSKVSEKAIRSNRYAKRTTFALSELGYHWWDLSEQTDGGLIAKAYATMQRTSDARRLLAIKSKPEAEAQGKQIEYEQANVRLGPYWCRPREIWARLVEQYVATRLGRETACAEAPEFYQSAPAYWSPEDFKNLVMEVEEALRKRLNLLAG